MRIPQPLTNTCGFSTRKHVIFCTLWNIYLYLLQKYLQLVTETWILVICFIDPACSMMINTLAMASKGKDDGPSSVGHN